MKHLLNIFGVTLIVAMVAFNSCSKYELHCPEAKPKIITITVKDTAEIKKLKEQNKQLWHSMSFYQKKYYDKCGEVKQTSAEIAQVDTPVITQTRNSWPIVAEYNARTDKWPLPSKNPKVIAAQEHNRIEWEALWDRSKDYRREQDEKLFKP